VLATRSAYAVPIEDLVRACAAADIVISDRWLPRRCRPRWLRLDRTLLARTGGVAITFPRQALALTAFASRRPTIRTVRHPGDAHPWIMPPDPRSAKPARRYRFRRRRSANDQS
jgi:competence protein ComEC